MAVPVAPKLRELLKQFVCVRAVQMWGLDLDKYQFDGFMTWAVFFLNADGTIYGRYGSRWVLHHAKSPDTLEMLIDRGGQSRRVSLQLNSDWRNRLGDWRYMDQLLQGYQVNFRTWDADSETRKKLGLGEDSLALKVSWVDHWKHRPASVLRDGDIIVAINGDRCPQTTGSFTAQLFRKPARQAMRLTIIRHETETLEIEIP